MKKTPSRILNEPASFLSLGPFDIAASGYFLILTYHLLKIFGIEILSFPIAALFALCLIAIRSNKRPHIIRDKILHLSSKRISFNLRTLK